MITNCAPYPSNKPSLNVHDILYTTLYNIVICRIMALKTSATWFEIWLDVSYRAEQLPIKTIASTVWHN